MKLLIYSHAFAPQVGGIETFVEHLAVGLSTRLTDSGAKNFDVTVVTQTAEPSGASGRGFPLKVVRKPSIPRLWTLIGEADRILLAGPAILPLLFGLLRRKRAVVTHHGYQAICPNGMLFQFLPQTNCPGHFAAGRYAECLCCNAPQEGWGCSLKLLLLTFIRRELAKRAAANVGVSDHVCKRIALPHSRVIRNAAIDSGDRTMSTIPAESSDPEVCFAYIGRLVTEKGVRVLLEAAYLLGRQGVTPLILIVGDGPERLALERQKASLQLGQSVTFLGFQSGPALEKLMRQISVLIMPSLCEDVAPLSVLEMMMQGRLIICSRTGGLAEQVGQAGLTFAPGNAQELAQRLREVLENPGLIRSLGQSARERATSHYTLQRMIGEYEDLLAWR